MYWLLSLKIFSLFLYILLFNLGVIDFLVFFSLVIFFDLIFIALLSLKG